MKAGVMILMGALAFGAIGLWIGVTIHGWSGGTLVPSLAGAAGGAGIVCAGFDVARRMAATRAAQ